MAHATTTPGFAVLPALLQDVEKIYDVYFSAFKADSMGRIMLEILFPGGYDGDEFRAAHAKATREYWTSTQNQYTWKVVDTDTGEIVGMILADVYTRARTKEERQNVGVPWLEGKQRTRAETILGSLWDARERILGGRPYVYAHVIAVDPKHQGRKAGAMICKWGADMAEACRLPLYFEASPSTVGLYKKMGFQVLSNKVVHGAGALEMAEDVEVPLMVMMPKALGDNFEEWREETADLA
ncbi:uncharacterized protein DNG_05117 [Cephalotrichum gorgonifer]|uniref:N-acetyltransferase domain-containing protein n=1 Tax=Cephalotrichum gorgonifer TaxID=2041049 RepID=A0AAE8SVH3_9PEZI|nr:uncharacterized protein DNG_05117 [Cephalotrichum gorgonifer]